MDGSSRIDTAATTAAWPTAVARIAAAAFVVVWCTGYPAGKIAVLHAGPFTTLFLRFVFAAIVFGVLALGARAAWPNRRTLLRSAIVGLLSLALSFGGIYEGLRLGVSTGISALFIGAMPLATAVLASFVGERLTRWQWAGLALGFIGVLLVLEGRLDTHTGSSLGYFASFVGLLALSSGTLYQKRHSAAVDLRVGLFVQHAAAAVVMLPLALFAEHFHADWSGAYIGTLAWLVAVNSVGGLGLLFFLLRHGAATRVAALFYLTPPVTAVMGYFILDERLSLPMLPGFVLVAFGVWLGTRRAAVP